MTKAAMAMAEAAAVMEVAVEPAVAVRRSGRDGVAGAFSSVERAGWCRRKAATGAACEFSLFAGVERKVRTAIASGRRPEAKSVEFFLSTPRGTPFHTTPFCSH